ncbi:Cc1-like splicing factor domain-containing protein [Pandoravirus kuranda]|uniref:Cc1-like splicing factor domain-containing protein n=1 Tax=Pandoravirus kuranda TaxID=3019033 RepID=A0AA95J3E4_9VIRU|nr:Cc1-like splicing factor domain-containing protein [Pandoravirus kuranda]
MPKGRKERRNRRHSDSDIRAGPWTDSSGSASEDEAARGFIDDVTADLARVDPTNGIVMGLPWEAPLAASSKIKNRQKARKEKEAKGHSQRRKRQKDKDRRRSASPQRAHRREHGSGAGRNEANDRKGKKKARAPAGAGDATRGQRSALREWTRHFEAEARDAETVLALVECSEWLRRYRAWLVEWRVASGDCRRALRRARPHEVDITLRGLRGAYAARAAGADALRALLSSTTPAQRRDPNWVRVHHFGGAYVASTDRLDAWIAGIASQAP